MPCNVRKTNHNDVVVAATTYHHWPVGYKTGRFLARGNLLTAQPPTTSQPTQLTQLTNGFHLHYLRLCCHPRREERRRNCYRRGGRWRWRSRLQLRCCVNGGFERSLPCHLLFSSLVFATRPIRLPLFRRTITCQLTYFSPRPSLLELASRHPGPRPPVS